MRYLVSFILMIGSSTGGGKNTQRVHWQVVDKIVASELNAQWLGTRPVDFSRDYSCGLYYGEYLDIFIFIGYIMKFKKNYVVKLLRK